MGDVIPFTPPPTVTQDQMYYIFGQWEGCHPLQKHHHPRTVGGVSLAPKTPSPQDSGRGVTRSKNTITPGQWEGCHPLQKHHDPRTVGGGGCHPLQKPETNCNKATTERLSLIITQHFQWLVALMPKFDKATWLFLKFDNRHDIK